MKAIHQGIDARNLAENRQSMFNFCSLEIWLQLDGVSALSTKFRSELSTKRAFKQCLRPTKVGLLQRHNFAFKELAFSIIYMPLIEYLFFLLQNCHSIKSILENKEAFSFTSLPIFLTADNKENNAKPQRQLVRKKFP